MAIVKIIGTKGDDSINILLDGYHNPYWAYAIYAGSGDDFVVGGFNNDEIYGENGNDILSGAFGNDILDGGNGNDIMAGFLVMITANVVQNPFLPDDPTQGIIVPETTNEIMYGGNGNDIMAGGSLQSTIVSSFANVTLLATYGDNILWGGNGDDTIYGNNGAFTYQNTAASSHLELYQRTLSGSNELHGGNGNDILVAGSGSFILNTGDFAGVTSAHVDAEDRVNPNGNHLMGDAGNDTLMEYGAMIEILLNVDGHNIHDWASDTMEGGSGNDFLIGDMKFLQTVVGPNLHQEENFGMDTLIGGTGNDTLVGDVFEIGAGENAILTYANDTFVFDLASSSGKDVILDMNAGGVLDTLKFTGAGGTSVADVNNDIASFVNNNGHVQVNFLNGASIDFANIAFNSQSSIMDITSHIVAIV